MAQTVFPARFASKCAACGGRVSAGTLITKGFLGYRHDACPASPEPAPVRQDAAVELPTPLRDGYFTVVLGAGERRTIRVSTGGDAKDVQFVGFLSGPNNESDYQTCGYVRDGKFRWTRRYAAQPPQAVATAIAALVCSSDEQRHAMGVAWARESGNCYRCNRTLTTPESIEAGVGPVCAGRG